MTMTNASSNRPTTAIAAGLAADEIRILIAQHLDVNIERVTDEAHFTDDLGADWLDRVELMIAIEDRFIDVEITDDDADQIDVVGDLIRHVESVAGNVARAPVHRRSATPAIRKFWGPRWLRPAWKVRANAAAAVR
jgi:acyl carrier protein